MDKIIISIDVLIYTCSKCGKKFYDVKSGFHLVPYCPHCEARATDENYIEDRVEVFMNTKNGNLNSRYRNQGGNNK